jgi:hypothetical protein
MNQSESESYIECTKLQAILTLLRVRYCEVRRVMKSLSGVFNSGSFLQITEIAHLTSSGFDLETKRQCHKQNGS